MIIRNILDAFVSKIHSLEAKRLIAQEIKEQEIRKTQKYIIELECINVSKFLETW